MSEEPADDDAQRILPATRSQACQLATVVDGELRSVAIGTTSDGEPYRADHLAPAYCMSRIPLLGTLLVLIGDGAVDPEAPVGRYASLPYLDPSATVLDVVDHRAGLTTPDVLTWRMAAPEQRPALLPDAALPPAFGYSDLLSNLVVSAVIEAVAAAPAGDVVEECLISPAGASGHVRYGVDGAEVHPAVAGLPHTVVPLLSERLADQIADVAPATGVYASAEGLARVLAWLFLDGPGAHNRRHRVVAAARPAEWDPVLGRPASYAYGFMSDLAGHGLHGPSSASFGHLAAIAGWVAAVEPDERSVQVGYANGVLISEQDGWRVRNVLAAAMSGDWARIGVDPAPLPGDDAGLGPWRTEPFAGLTDLVGAQVLPADWSFTVDIHLTDTDVHATLDFGAGALRGIHEPTAGTAGDVSLSADRAVLEAWLHDPSTRLGAVMSNGRLVADGALWYLSALEYWAAYAADVALATGRTQR